MYIYVSQKFNTFISYTRVDRGRNERVSLCFCCASGKQKVLVTQSCPTLCHSVDCGLPGSSVYGVLHARILEWVVIPFSRESSQIMDQTWVSHIAARFFTIWATREVLLANAGEVGDVGLIPGSRRSLGGGHCSPLQYSCWIIPWTEQHSRLLSIGLQRVGHDGSNLACTHVHMSLRQYLGSKNLRHNWKE